MQCTRETASTHGLACGKQRRDDRWTRALHCQSTLLPYYSAAELAPRSKVGGRRVCATATAGDPGSALPACAKPLAREKSERIEKCLHRNLQTFLGRDVAVCCRPIVSRAFLPCIVDLSARLCPHCSRRSRRCLPSPARPPLALHVVNVANSDRRARVNSGS